MALGDTLALPTLADGAQAAGPPAQMRPSAMGLTGVSPAPPSRAQSPGLKSSWLAQVL